MRSPLGEWAGGAPDASGTSSSASAAFPGGNNTRGLSGLLQREQDPRGRTPDETRSPNVTPFHTKAPAADAEDASNPTLASPENDDDGTEAQ